MIVGLCHTKHTLRGKYMLKSMMQGIRQCGDSPIWIEVGDERKLQDADVLIQICTANKHHKNVASGGFRKLIQRHASETGKNIAIIDTGFIKSQWDAERVGLDLKRPETYTAFDTEAHYSFGFGGLKRHGEYFNERSLPDRWKRLNVEMADWRKTNGPILVLGQPLFGASSQHINIYEWYRTAVESIARQTDRQIVIRQHPRHTFLEKHRHKDISDIRKQTSHVDWKVSDVLDLADDVRRAYCTVAYSTTAAVQSVLEGTPTVCGNDICMAWDVAGHNIHRIKPLKRPDRTQWAWNLAYAQWNVAEMKTGEAWAHLRPYAKK